MKDGHYEIIVFNPRTKAQYAERVIHSKTYVVAKPGEEYKVMVVINEPYRIFPSNYCVRLNLRIDGHQVSSRVILSADLENDRVSRTFDGFRQSNEHSDSYYAFTFTGEAENGGTHGDGRNGNEVGELKVHVYSGHQQFVPREDKPMRFSEPVKTMIAIQENQKFWHQPSVATQMGRQIDVAKRSYHDEVLGRIQELEKELTLSFHTAQVLDLLEWETSHRGSSKAVSGFPSSVASGSAVVIDLEDGEVVDDEDDNDRPEIASKKCRLK